jgi:hypothetical protein
MDFPVFLDTLAYSYVERFHEEAAQQRLVSAALGPRPSRVPSLGRRLWATARGSAATLREPVSSSLPLGGVNPS